MEESVNPSCSVSKAAHSSLIIMEIKKKRKYREVCERPTIWEWGMGNYLNYVFYGEKWDGWCSLVLWGLKGHPGNEHGRLLKSLVSERCHQVCLWEINPWVVTDWGFRANLWLRELFSSSCPLRGQFFLQLPGQPVMLLCKTLNPPYCRPSLLSQ